MRIFVIDTCCENFAFVFGFIGGGKKKEVKKETGLGLSFKKDENFGEWYSEVRWNCLFFPF